MSTDIRTIASRVQLSAKVRQSPFTGRTVSVLTIKSFSRDKLGIESEMRILIPESALRALCEYHNIDLKEPEKTP